MRHKKLDSDRGMTKSRDSHPHTAIATVLSASPCVFLLCLILSLNFQEVDSFLVDGGSRLHCQYHRPLTFATTAIISHRHSDFAKYQPAAALSALRMTTTDNSNSNKEVEITNAGNKKEEDSPPVEVASASFGESVPLKASSDTSSSSTSSSSSLFGASTPLESSTSSSITTIPQEQQQVEQAKRRNLLVGTLSVVMALANYVWQYTHPITPIQLLADMEQQSVPITTIGRNQKPTVVDFWAPWCENCKYMAPTLQTIEQEYGDRVNFVMVNGDKPEAWPLIDAFGVDAIPHLAMVSADGDVETALIGPIPKHVLEADIDTLLANAHSGTENASGGPKRALPYQMLDVFKDQAEGSRRIRFVEVNR